VYPDPRVVSFVTEHFVPVKIDVRKNPQPMDRLQALWTPTILLLDPDGVERYRLEGYLPVEGYLARLTLGLGHIAFATKDWVAAEAWFHEVVEKYGESEVAPEALYWEGVSRYKAGDQSALGRTAQEFKQRYTDTDWAKKSSVWAH
jgi:hypothetical protein